MTSSGPLYHHILCMLTQLIHSVRLFKSVNVLNSGMFTKALSAVSKINTAHQQKLSLRCMNLAELSRRNFTLYPHGGSR